MRRLLILTILAVGLVGATLPALAQVEGYDPLRIISAQIARPSIYIVMDVSGSMEWDINGATAGVDGVGTWATAAWSSSKSNCAPAPNTTKCKTWVYTLTVSQKLPSRAATVKNAMGNSVSIWPPWEKPADTAYPLKTTFPATWTTQKDTANKNSTGTTTGPVYTFASAATTTYKWAWTVNFAVPAGGTGFVPDPTTPFVCIQTIDTNAAAPKYGTYLPQVAPQDLLGQTADSVNWGLYTYSTDGYTLQSAIDSNDTGVVTTLENKMKLNSAGGLNVGGSTPTKTALANIKTQLQNTFNNDPKYNCGRTYAAILLTDGLSNSGNPGGGNWISPCGACPGPSCCDVGSSGSNCPNNYASFPAGASEDLWKTTWVRGGTTYRVPVRTWVIGVSNAVGPCELNYTAYMGRTDASSPNGDAGFALNSSWPFPTAASAVKPSDPYLPQTNGDTTKYQLTHGNYAYFATSAYAIKAAFEAIVAALGPGDYATAQPIVSTATGAASGQVSLLASSEYPGFKGHLYGDKISDGTPLWDAGAMLSKGVNSFPDLPDGRRDPRNSPLTPRNMSTRKLYTWNAATNALVEITSANVATLNSLCGACGITAAVVDYIRGNNGSGVSRSWPLGALINSTPTIIAGPVQWKSDQVPNHSGFEGTYGARHPLVYIGSSDGMLHGFDAVDGYEVFGLVSPANLSEQVTFYNNYISNPTKYPTGEPIFSGQHIYGVANSPRVQDVWFPQGSGGEWKTVIFLTEGPSSKTVAAIDVTHPYPGRTGVMTIDGVSHDYDPDTNYSTTDPVEILWTKANAQYPALQYTWSIPAEATTVASTSNPKCELVMGSGWNSASTRTSQVAPTIFALQSDDGSSDNIVTLSNLAAPVPFVGNQAFADTVLFNYDQRIFQEGWPQDVAIQADLNGRIWFLNRDPQASTATAQFNAAATAGQSQPIYYSPAVAGFKDYMNLAFASGSYFEKSTQVNGAAATFRSRLYLHAYSTTSTPQTKVWKTTDLSNTVGVGTLSDQSTVVAPPIMLVPNVDTGLAIALFAIYDPASGDCAGTSYVAKITFDPASLTGATVEMNLIGSGTISGFTVAGNVILVAKSGKGSERATAPVVPNVSVGGSQNGLVPVWWRELQ